MAQQPLVQCFDGLVATTTKHNLNILTPMKKRIVFKSFDALSFPMLITHAGQRNEADGNRQVIPPAYLLHTQLPPAATKQDLRSWLNSGVKVVEKPAAPGSRRRF
jgi:hypothetical protein